MLNYISSLPSSSFAETWPRNIAILGSTGFIGRLALEVILGQPQYFRVVALAGGRNIKLLAQQAELLRPDYLAVQDIAGCGELSSLLGYSPEILYGQQGYATLASLAETHIVLSAQVGAAGLHGTWAAIQAGKVVALANKESIILAGDLMRRECVRSGASILPVDSEHNAIFQCLSGQMPLHRATEGSIEPATACLLGRASEPGPTAALKRIILTASGGPLRGKSKDFLAKVRKEDALRHPTWQMGAKISIDSATLMNKGLEIIEACHLYGLPEHSVEVIVHPQSIIHSLVEYHDHSQLAQMGVTDMRIPISVCLGWPYRLQSGAARLSLLDPPAMTFEKPDIDAFPALKLCRSAFTGGQGFCIALNAANEIAVSLFLQDRLSFTGISELISATLDAWAESSRPCSIAEALDLDARARALATEFVESGRMIMQ